MFSRTESRRILIRACLVVSAGVLCPGQICSNGDLCPADPDKTEPGVCGCGVVEDLGDADGDTIINCLDNCPAIPNPDQADTDGDDWGDVCDACPGDAGNDPDGDGLCALVDNCPTTANADQADSDADGAGNVCDNCPMMTNPDQADTDGDGHGDVCDNCPGDPAKTDPGHCGCGKAEDVADNDGDGTINCLDNCPSDPNKAGPGLCGCGVVEDTGDTDGDGTINCLDGCPNDPNKTAPGATGCGNPPTVGCSCGIDGPGTLTLSIGGGVTMKFELIPAGTFTMGSDAFSSPNNEDERPLHSVTISRPFYMGKCEVTQIQWEILMGDNPAYFTGASDSDCRPVELVSFDDCVAFCQALSVRLGRTIRLPTEAEWEYACRAGSAAEYCYGNLESKLGQYGWYTSNSSGRTHAVGSKRANFWNLHDMHGNVWEWCSDWYDADYYSTCIPSCTDPEGPASGDKHVLRGGSWDHSAKLCRSAERYVHRSPQAAFIGFRVLAEVP